MSREIKFRAKSLKTNEFVFGFFGQRTETSPVRETTQTYTINYILVDNGFCGFEEIEIDIKTLGQYTGFVDINGIKIFEGDIVRLNSINYEIIYRRYHACFMLQHKDYSGEVFFHFFHEKGVGNWENTEIIGNIYENKELITGVKND